jgi:hypothetical protein
MRYAEAGFLLCRDSSKESKSRADDILAKFNALNSHLAGEWLGCSDEKRGYVHDNSCK